MQVAPPQPPRLLGEAERPLEPEPLEAVGRLLLDARVEVERGADADQHRRVAGRPGAPRPPRIRATQFSCSGTPRPPQTTSAPAALMRAAVSDTSSPVRSRNGA